MRAPTRRGLVAAALLPLPALGQARWSPEPGMARSGIEPRLSPSPAAFVEFVTAETGRRTRVIREAGITAQ